MTRVDDVVAGEVERIGQREYPFVILVLAVRNFPERIERLRTELVSLRVEWMTAIPHAVLRCVSIDDKRRVRAGKNGSYRFLAVRIRNGNSVSTHAHAAIEVLVVGEDG